MKIHGPKALIISIKLLLHIWKFTKNRRISWTSQCYNSLLFQEEGYTFVEMNASSCRNKSALQSEVACQLSSMAITSFLARKEGVASAPKKRALIMDEVDGMDGNADRGGVSVSMPIGAESV